MENKKNIIHAATGASGAVYGMHLLQSILSLGHQCSFIISPAALRVSRSEIDPSITSEENYIQSAVSKEKLESIRKNLNVYNYMDIGSKPASGSAHYDGMVIAPCSMNTLAAIACGLSGNLIERAADVCLKERRKLILLIRETPYSSIHLKNMTELTHAGAVILPASPGFYHRPQKIEDIIQFITQKILSQLGITENIIEPWKGDNESA